MPRLRGLVVLLLLVVTGCGTATTQVEGDAAGDEGVRAGETADLSFTATTLDGERFDAATLEGRPTVLWFWAPWCPTCRSQIDTVSGIGEEYEGRVNVVAVGGLDTQDEIEAMAGEIDHVTHLVDDEGVVWKHFGVTAQSTYTVVDSDGAIAHEGYLSDGDLEELVAGLAD
jgi:thiol-disulfide isomerase/thioredoxin